MNKDNRSVHTTVLLHESIDGLDIHPGNIYLDGTLGGGGHSVYALQKTKGNLTLIGLDEDEDALKRSEKKIAEVKTDASKIFLEKANFRDMDKVLHRLRIGKIHAIILDLGLSSDQFEVSERGFTFKKDEPLLMTFNKNPLQDDFTAAYIVNNWEEKTIADIIFGYGEERYAKRIAQRIVEYRIKKKIETSGELAEIVSGAVPSLYRRGRIHPATRTFQALRIAVNDELNALKDGLLKGFERLTKGGRMAVISFHSLEDRIVKHFYKEKADEEKAKIITKKPIVPGEKEVLMNPRSRSAKLRILEKTI